MKTTKKKDMSVSFMAIQPIKTVKILQILMYRESKFTNYLHFKNNFRRHF